MIMLIKTYRHLLADIVRLSGIHLDAPDEISLSWVLIEGPALDKQLLKYLEHGEAERPSFPSWLAPLWEAFLLKQEACMLRYLRQLLVFCYKAEFEPSDDQKTRALCSFLDTDEAIRLWDFSSNADPKCPMLRHARQLIGLIIHKIDWSNIIPSHGPGGVYPSRLPSDKSNFDTFYPNIADQYPYDQYFCGLPAYWHEVFIGRIVRLKIAMR